VTKWISTFEGWIWHRIIIAYVCNQAKPKAEAAADYFQRVFKPVTTKILPKNDEVAIAARSLKKSVAPEF
jgi:hypothetical protein